MTSSKLTFANPSDASRYYVRQHIVPGPYLPWWRRLLRWLHFWRYRSVVTKVDYEAGEIIVTTKRPWQ